MFRRMDRGWPLRGDTWPGPGKWGGEDEDGVIGVNGCNGCNGWDRAISVFPAARPSGSRCNHLQCPVWEPRYRESQPHVTPRPLCCRSAPAPASHWSVVPPSWAVIGPRCPGPGWAPDLATSGPGHGQLSSTLFSEDTCNHPTITNQLLASAPNLNLLVQLLQLYFNNYNYNFTTTTTRTSTLLQ